ncbi:hypothetical protein [Afifella pfennigii]|uniref:hypothetical protein n=1 Tax=Afifella pfennigii TaxID=209897 RepID=UPI00146FC72C|nr:hypothetical protein [Afifella pfennigii]
MLFDLFDLGASKLRTARPERSACCSWPDETQRRDQPGMGMVHNRAMIGFQAFLGRVTRLRVDAFGGRQLRKSLELSNPKRGKFIEWRST